MKNYWKSIGCLLLLSTLLTSCGGGTTDSGGNPTNPVGFTQLFGKTFLHPRCQNCHGFDAGNAIRDRHVELGRIDMDCAECHFTPGWRPPFRSFTFSGKTTSQICEGIKSMAGQNLQKLRDEMVGSTLARWGIEDGGTIAGKLQTAPPGSMAELAVLLDQWIAGGASCD